jgi:hypothetical protein
MAAGTDRDLISLARLAVRSANGGSGGAEAGTAGETFGGALIGFAIGFVCIPLCALCTAGVTFPPVCEAHIDATAATLPPCPPRADRMLYFASGLGVSGQGGKQGGSFEFIRSVSLVEDLGGCFGFCPKILEASEGGDPNRSILDDWGSRMNGNLAEGSATSFAARSGAL